jgi:DNA repair protein RecN (Recombination protein N)
MLLELKVTNFAVIDALQVNFLRPGLNILTGETGAGKSILIKSLSLLLGGKASPDVIRSGQDQAVIEGAFDLTDRSDLKKDLEELALDSGDHSLVVRRIISQSGKHRIYINGHLSTLNILERIVPRLVEITGQHEHHSLIKPASQLAVLDEFADLAENKKRFFSLFKEAASLRSEIQRLTNAARDREQRLDFLKFQITEIENFSPMAGEDEALTSKHQRARFATKLHTFAQKAEAILYSQELSVSAMTGDLIREGEPLIELDPKLKAMITSLRESLAVIDDTAFSFRDYAKTETLDEQELELIEDRMSQFKKLQKKYGATIEDIIKFKDQAISELTSLESSDENLKILSQGLKKIESELRDEGGFLSLARTKASLKLSRLINNELKELNMKGVDFSVQVLKTENLNTSGFDEVTFLIQSSPKDEPRPISKVASGGELSRLMLAIKQVIAASDRPMTYLFDEVDTGVSGPTAEKVGRKLKAISTVHQVICITHLPQVAAFADAHFLITKEVSKGLVKSEINELDQKARIQELGRMISGEKITAASLAHAKQMIEENFRSKQI